MDKIGAIKEIKLSEIQYPISSRFGGKRLYEDILNELNLPGNENLVFLFNFEKVEYLSTGFSKELFGELYQFLGLKFSDHISFKFGDNKEIIQSSIIRGISSIDDEAPQEYA